MQHPDPHSLLTLIKVCAFATANSCEIRCFISSFRACMSEGLDVGFDAPLKKDMVEWLYGKGCGRDWRRRPRWTKVDGTAKMTPPEPHCFRLIEPAVCFRRILAGRVTCRGILGDEPKAGRRSSRDGGCNPAQFPLRLSTPHHGQHKVRTRRRRRQGTANSR